MSIADMTGEWFENDLLRAAHRRARDLRQARGPAVGRAPAAMLLQRMADDPEPVGSGVTVVGGPGALTQALAAVARTGRRDDSHGGHASRAFSR